MRASIKFPQVFNAKDLQEAKVLLEELEYEVIESSGGLAVEE